jgi:hypothetical protein
MATDLETGIEYYKDLLLYQYINQPNARETIGLLVQQALVDLLPNQVIAAFDLETATGAQLDILGEYIGFDRVVTSTISRIYFALDDYLAPDTSIIGFTDYTDSSLNMGGSTYLYTNSNAETTLTDAEYRVLLKLKILINISDFSLYQIENEIYGAFGDNLVVYDNMDMSLTYYASKNYTRIIDIAKNENLLPKPMGVRLDVYGQDSNYPLWGLSSYVTENTNSIGFSSYTAWTEGEILDYENRM